MGARRTTVTLRAGAMAVVVREQLSGESVSGTICRLIEGAGSYLNAQRTAGLVEPLPKPPKRKRGEGART
jgi:hypothetical protein